MSDFNEMMERMKLQTAEFDALHELSKRYQSLCNVAIVDDDYPEYRHYYESSLRTFLKAVKQNSPGMWDII